MEQQLMEKEKKKLHLREAVERGKMARIELSKSKRNWEQVRCKAIPNQRH